AAPGRICPGRIPPTLKLTSSRTIPAPINIPVPLFFRLRALLAAAVMFPALTRAQRPADSLRTVTLPEALAMAARVNPALAAGKAAVTTARANRRVVTGEYLPSLGVASSAGRGTTVQGGSGVTNGIPVSSAVRQLDDLYGSGISAAVP